MKEIDKQQKQSGMTAEELLFELDQLRIKYKGYKPDIEESSPRIDESIDLINQFKSDICKSICWHCKNEYPKCKIQAHCTVIKCDNFLPYKEPE